MTASKSSAIRWGALIAGGVLFAAAVRYVDFDLVNAVHGLSVAVPLALVASGLWHVTRTWAWASCFPPQRGVGFLHLARVRLAAEAFSYLTLRGIAGEPLKVVLLHDRLDARVVTAAVALERVAYLAGTTIIVGIGSLIAMLALPLSGGWFRVFCGLAVAAGVTVILATLVVGGRGRYVTGLLAAWDRRVGTSVRTGRVGRFVSSVEGHILALVRGNPARLTNLTIATLLSYVLMILEAWLILRACGTPSSMTAAIAIETFSRAASFASAFIPANLGALEASSLAAAAAAGVGGAGGALALTRRIRGLFWAGIGLALYPRAVRTEVFGKTPSDAAAGPNARSSGTVLYVMRDARVSVSPHVRLAGLPLSERVLRAALRVHPETVVLIWMGNASSGDMASDRYFERTAAQFGSRVRLIRDAENWRAAVRDIESVTVIGPGTLVSPALLTAAATQPASTRSAVDVPAGATWPISGVVRMSGAEAANIPVLLDTLHARLRAEDRPSGEDVAMGRAYLALRLTGEHNLPAAEQTLRRSSYKSTDAKIARFNRSISLPISVRLIRTPLTANQLSLILVALGFYSAWLFSIGAYLPGVLGGFLSLAASVLDGCDGEIARLKYQESALGCWIETIGDYSYYIAVFVGLTMGAVRHTGWEIFYWFGTAALAGTLLSFGLLIYLRSRITNGQPDRLHAIAKARFKAEPTFWSRIVWRVSFVATRAAMPYGIMVLALVNLLPLVVFLAAVGANVYWISLVLKLRDLLGSDDPVTA